MFPKVIANEIMLNPFWKLSLYRIFMIIWAGSKLTTHYHSSYLPLSPIFSTKLDLSLLITLCVTLNIGWREVNMGKGVIYDLIFVVTYWVIWSDKSNFENYYPSAISFINQVYFWKSDYRNGVRRKHRAKIEKNGW